MNRKLYRSNTPAKKLRAGTPPRPSSPCKIQLKNIKEQRTDFICGPCREQLDGLTCIGNVNAYLSSERRRHGRSEVIVTYRMQMRRTDSARRDHGLRPTRALQYGLNWLRPFQTTWNYAATSTEVCGHWKNSVRRQAAVPVKDPRNVSRGNIRHWSATTTASGLELQLGNLAAKNLRLRSTLWCFYSIIMPPPPRRGIKQLCYLTSVCLSDVCRLTSVCLVHRA